VAVKLAVVEPAATETEAGTIRAALLLAIATEAPLAEDKVTVQVDVAPDTTEAGKHCNDVTVVSGAIVIEAVPALPFNAAVTVAV